MQNFYLLLVDQYWLATGCLFHTTFKMERQTLISINNSNHDSHFYYEPSLLQWLVLISDTWASIGMCIFSMRSLLMQSKDGLINGMCIFSMCSLLMQSKDGLIVIREVLNIFLGCKAISIDSGFWIMKMIFHILPQLRSHYLCQLSMNLVMLRYVS